MSNQMTADEVIKLISQKKNIPIEKIESMVEETMESLDNFINRQGAAHLLASNLDVAIVSSSVKETPQLNIANITQGMDGIRVVGRISRIYPTKHFMKNDIPSRLRKLDLVDSTGTIGTTLWGHHSSIIEELGIARGDVITISNAVAKINSYNEKIELSVGNKSSIDNNLIGIDVNDFPEINSGKIPISSIETSDSITVVGKIVRVRENRSFVRKTDGAPSIVGGFTLEDKTGQVGVTFWGEDTNKLEKLEVGQVVKLLEFSSRYNSKLSRNELVCKNYSKIEGYSDASLDKIEVQDSASEEITYLKIGEIKENSFNLGIKAKVCRLNKIFEFKSGRFQSILLFDSTGLITAKFWNEAIESIEELKQGDIIQVSGLRSVHNNYSDAIELNSGIKTDIKINDPADVLELNDVELKTLKFSEFKEIENYLTIRLHIQRKHEVNEITRENGSTSRVLNFDVNDEDSTKGRLNAWDESISLVENFDSGDTILVSIAQGKLDEFGAQITIREGTQITPVNDFNEDAKAITSERKIANEPEEITEISQLAIGNILYKIRGKITRIFPNMVIYDSCDKCSKKLNVEKDGSSICYTHNYIENPLKRMIITCVIDDMNGGTINSKFFGHSAEKLLTISAEEAFNLNKNLSDDSAAIKKHESEIVHTVLNLVGKVVKSSSEETLEFNVSTFYKVDN